MAQEERVIISKDLFFTSDGDVFYLTVDYLKEILFLEKSYDGDYTRKYHIRISRKGGKTGEISYSAQSSRNKDFISLSYICEYLSNHSYQEGSMSRMVVEAHSNYTTSMWTTGGSPSGVGQSADVYGMQGFPGQAGTSTSKLINEQLADECEEKKGEEIPKLKKGGFDKMVKTIKEYYFKYRDVILTVGLILIVDHVFFDGVGRIKVKTVINDLFKKAEKKLEG